MDWVARSLLPRPTIEKGKEIGTRESYEAIDRFDIWRLDPMGEAP